MDLLVLGKEPISAEQPAGSDVRYEPEFEELQAEIDKLSSPTSSGGTDWNKVSQMATEILASKSKDLLAASYLAVAQIHTHQMEGFAVGLHVFRDLLEEFWEDLFPPKKRMRGRKGALEWWIEKSETALDMVGAQSLEPEQVEELKAVVGQIDDFLSEYLEEPPSVRGIQRFLDDLPDESEGKARPAETPDRAKPSSPAEPEDIASEKDAQIVLRSALRKVRQVSSFLGKEERTNPQVYRLARIAIWSGVAAPPPATDGSTRIPPPAAQIQNILRDVRDRGDWETLLQSAEANLSQFLFWLDLNRFTAEALGGLGDKYEDALESVCQETAFFDRRFSTVKDLSFSDGTPFADPETKQWLQSVQLGDNVAAAQPVGADGGRDGSFMAEAMQKAQALAKKKKLPEAVASLQKGLRSSFSKREQLLWRLGLSQILMNSKQPQLALPHLQAIVQDIDMFRLEEWDPDLALKALKMVWFGLKSRTDKATKAQALDVLSRIAKLDPAEGLRLGKP